MTWILILYIASSPSSMGVTMPVGSPGECLAVASQQLHKFAKEHGTKVEAVSVMCLRERRGV